MKLYGLLNNFDKNMEGINNIGNVVKELEPQISLVLQSILPLLTFNARIGGIKDIQNIYSALFELEAVKKAVFRHFDGSQEYREASRKATRGHSEKDSIERADFKNTFDTFVGKLDLKTFIEVLETSIAISREIRNEALRRPQEEKRYIEQLIHREINKNASSQQELADIKENDKRKETKTREIQAKIDERLGRIRVHRQTLQTLDTQIDTINQTHANNERRITAAIAQLREIEQGGTIGKPLEDIKRVISSITDVMARISALTRSELPLANLETEDRQKFDRLLELIAAPQSMPELESSEARFASSAERILRPRINIQAIQDSWTLTQALNLIAKGYPAIEAQEAGDGLPEPRKLYAELKALADRHRINFPSVEKMLETVQGVLRSADPLLLNSESIQPILQKFRNLGIDEINTILNDNPNRPVSESIAALSAFIERLPEDDAKKNLHLILSELQQAELSHIISNGGDLPRILSSVQKILLNVSDTVPELKSKVMPIIDLVKTTLEQLTTLTISAGEVRATDNHKDRAKRYLPRALEQEVDRALHISDLLKIISKAEKMSDFTPDHNLELLKTELTLLQANHNANLTMPEAVAATIQTVKNTIEGTKAHIDDLVATIKSVLGGLQNTSAEAGYLKLEGHDWKDNARRLVTNGLRNQAAHTASIESATTAIDLIDALSALEKETGFVATREFHVLKSHLEAAQKAHVMALALPERLAFALDRLPVFASGLLEKALTPLQQRLDKVLEPIQAAFLELVSVTPQIAQVELDDAQRQDMIALIPADLASHAPYVKQIEAAKYVTQGIEILKGLQRYIDKKTPQYAAIAGYLVTLQTIQHDRMNDLTPLQQAGLLPHQASQAIEEVKNTVDNVNAVIEDVRQLVEGVDGKIENSVIKPLNKTLNKATAAFMAVTSLAVIGAGILIYKIAQEIIFPLVPGADQTKKVVTAGIIALFVVAAIVAAFFYKEKEKKPETTMKNESIIPNSAPINCSP